MTIYTPKTQNVKIHFSLTSSPSQLIYANALEIQDTGIYVIYDNTYDDMIHIHGNKIFIDIKKEEFTKQYILEPSVDGTDLVTKINGKPKSISELLDFFKSSKSNNEYVSGGARKARKRRQSRKKSLRRKTRSKGKSRKSKKSRRSKKRRNLFY